MDLLGSIMNSMEKPPNVDTKERLRQKSLFYEIKTCVVLRFHGCFLNFFF